MRIAVVAPARGITPEIAARAGACAAAVAPDAELVFHPQCFLSDGHFAGADAMRAAALVDVANDGAFDAVWFARGGYGSNRLLHAVLPRLGAAARAKAWLGFSDLGFLLGAFYAAGIGRPAHGPLVADILRDADGACFARGLRWLAARDRSTLEGGLDSRPAAAFNLAVLASLSGTAWLPDLTGHVLLIEDVAEPLYRIDRMLFTVANAPQLQGIAGVRLGRVSDVIPNDPPWGETLETMIVRWCGEMRVPYLGRADIGHDAGNRVVPFGLA